MNRTSYFYCSYIDSHGIKVTVQYHKSCILNTKNIIKNKQFLPQFVNFEW